MISRVWNIAGYVRHALGQFTKCVTTNCEITKVSRLKTGDNCADQRQGVSILKIEHFDSKVLWDRVACDPELLRELVELFMAESPRMLARIEEAIKDGSGSDLEKASHKIKGSVLQFSAHAAAAIALELEKSGRLGSTKEAEPLLKKLVQEIHRLQQALHGMAGDKAGRFQE
jgi:HPt (histidine-containing phosphotransfer) domain-containing protein